MPSLQEYGRRIILAATLSAGAIAGGAAVAEAVNAGDLSNQINTANSPQLLSQLTSEQKTDDKISDALLALSVLGFSLGAVVIFSEKGYSLGDSALIRNQNGLGTRLNADGSLTLLQDGITLPAQEVA
jgi:hypothetical protein